MSEKIWRSIQEEQQALKLLSYNGLRIYLYATEYPPHHLNLILSCENIMKTFRISRPTYYRAMQELKEKNFLIQINNELYLNREEKQWEKTAKEK